MNVLSDRPEIRKAVYIIVGAILALLALFNIIDQATADAVLAEVEKIIGALALLMAASNVNQAPRA